MAPSPITGRCLCGNVTFTAEGDAVVQAVCHCTDCQRQTGNPFSVIVGVPREGFTRPGRHALFLLDDRRGPRRRNRSANFCSACGSPLFSVAAAMPEMIFIKAGSLDDASWVQPSVEAWTSPRSRGRRTSRARRIESGPGSAEAEDPADRAAGSPNVESRSGRLRQPDGVARPRERTTPTERART